MLFPRLVWQKPKAKAAQSTVIREAELFQA